MILAGLICFGSLASAEITSVSGGYVFKPGENDQYREYNVEFAYRAVDACPRKEKRVYENKGKHFLLLTCFHEIVRPGEFEDWGIFDKTTSRFEPIEIRQSFPGIEIGTFATVYRRGALTNLRASVQVKLSCDLKSADCTEDSLLRHSREVALPTNYKALIAIQYREIIYNNTCWINCGPWRPEY